MTTPRPIPIKAMLEERRLEHLKLEVVAGGDGTCRTLISSPRIQKPGLALAGYLPYVKPGRVQIMGASEFEYLGTFDHDEAVSRLSRLIELDVPGIIASKGQRPPEEVIAFCNERRVPFLATGALTSDTIESVSAYLEDALAPRVQRHGVLVEVFALGTLIVGDPGIGKSECALELVHRGHRLVADDVVVISRTHDQGLCGRAHKMLRNYLELRGVGIIDVRKHFGMPATSSSVRISLVIELVKLDKMTQQREQGWRLQMMEKPRAWTSTEEILGVKVPKYTMAVAPGRDVAIMVETAVRKCMLADLGIQDERDFLDAVDRLARSDELESPPPVPRVTEPGGIGTNGSRPARQPDSQESTTSDQE